MGNTIFLTQEGHVKLQEELKNLKEVKRVEIAEKLKEAISFGDLSENSEYEEARNEQAQVELKISDLAEQLKHVEIIDEKAAHDADKVSMGSKVIIEDLELKEKQEYKIVGSTESNILAEIPMISNDSLVGAAVLGKKKGDIIKVKTQSGVYEYKIIDLK